MKICLIGNDYKQQFPLLGYGGIESTAEHLALGLYKHFQKEVKFCAIVPKILEGDKSQYKFNIVETDFVESSISRQPARIFAQQARQLIQSADIKPDVIWSQSHWSAQVLHDLNIPIICTNQDSGPWEDGKFFPKENVKYRMISQYLYDLVFRDAKDGNYIDQVKQNSFVQTTGMADEEYDFCGEKEDYILWVASFDWGTETESWHNKGLDKFLELAKLREDKNFVSYGSGHPEVEKKLKKYDKNLKNFQYGGQLKRGEEHKKAFKKAKLFAFLSQIEEAFGRTGLEAITKGTPVLGSTKGAIPELYGAAGVCTDDMKTMSETLDKVFDYQSIYDYSRKFHIKEEIEHLLRVSESML